MRPGPLGLQSELPGQVPAADKGQTGALSIERGRIKTVEQVLLIGIDPGVIVIGMEPSRLQIQLDPILPRFPTDTLRNHPASAGLILFPIEDPFISPFQHPPGRLGDPLGP